MRRRVRAAALLLAAAIAAVAAADPTAGRAKAQAACAVCHGTDGLALQPNVPHLAGQPVFYLAEQLRHYRSGRRRHEVMSLVAKPLTDAEIDNLAAWYSSLQVRVEVP